MYIINQVGHLYLLWLKTYLGEYLYAKLCNIPRLFSMIQMYAFFGIVKECSGEKGYHLGDTQKTYMTYPYQLLY